MMGWAGGRGRWLSPMMEAMRHEKEGLGPLSPLAQVGSPTRET